jgi:hypothetical protein
MFFTQMEEVMASRTASRQGKRYLVTSVEPVLHRKLKVFAAMSDQTLEETRRLAFVKFLDAAMASIHRTPSA